MAKQNLGNSKKLKTNAKTSRKMVFQRFWALLGYIATSIGIAVVIFQIGQHYGSASAKQQEFRHFVEYLEELKSGIRITSLSCLNNQISAGQTCALTLSIANQTPYECDLWVGTSAVDSHGNEIWNTTQDSLVSVSALGVTSIQRFLTFPINASHDIYDIHVNLWFGKLSDPTQSERISSASIQKQLIIQKIHNTEPFE